MEYSDKTFQSFTNEFLFWQVSVGFLLSKIKTFL